MTELGGIVSLDKNEDLQREEFIFASITTASTKNPVI